MTLGSRSGGSLGESHWIPPAVGAHLGLVSPSFTLAQVLRKLPQGGHGREPLCMCCGVFSKVLGGLWWFAMPITCLTGWRRLHKPWLHNQGCGWKLVTKCPRSSSLPHFGRAGPVSTTSLCVTAIRGCLRHIIKYFPVSHMPSMALGEKGVEESETNLKDLP